MTAFWVIFVWKTVVNTAVDMMKIADQTSFAKITFARIHVLMISILVDPMLNVQWWEEKQFALASTV